MSGWPAGRSQRRAMEYKPLEIVWDEVAEAWYAPLDDEVGVWGATRQEAYRKWLDAMDVRIAHRKNPDLYD